MDDLNGIRHNNRDSNVNGNNNGDGAVRNPAVDSIALVGIVGSLRVDAFNPSVMASARELLPTGVQLTEIGLRDLPLYDGDEESRVFPRRRVVAARGRRGGRSRHLHA
jgi:hypothetical protein